MTINRLSKNEGEHFTMHDQELLKKQRELAEAAQAAAERRLHLMKCPKDGYDLESRHYHGVEVEQCTNCGGVWLDRGDLEIIRSRKDHTGMVDRIVNDVLVSLGGDRRKTKRG
ncbi:MAG TPA: zf-TFIIB domain-containing protein [Gemmatimonadales bacterium]|jgi:hypothetical protein|nr:zf-TFIIB domain-containing protein [Gemmatimonadales bacterium]HXS24031.1 zf-TFIIB domain-containing protein [Gemmatimonadales bacterium]